MCGLSGDGAPGLTAPDGGNQELGMRKGNKRKGNAHSKGEGGDTGDKENNEKGFKKGDLLERCFSQEKKRTIVHHIINIGDQ